MKKSIYWIFLITGTVIGAGYASGREIWLFFGPNSGQAIILFSMLFGLCNYTILTISYQKQTTDYQPIFLAIVNQKSIRLYDGLTFIYLIMTTIIMVAASGAMLEVFELPKGIGIAFIVIMLIWIFNYNINQLLDINSIIVPVLLLTLIIILVLFIKNDISIENAVISPPNYFNAIKFTSVNLLPLISVIGAIGNKISSKNEVIITSFLSALCLGVVTWIYNHSMVLIEPEINLYQMPIYAILVHFPDITLIIMTFVIWLAIFLTALAAIIGIVSRLQSRYDYSQFRIALIAILFLTPFSFAGFQSLVEFIYPVFGVVNLYILIKLIIHPFKDWLKEK